jgi:DNA-binding transcriptional LysR family regulator
MEFRQIQYFLAIVKKGGFGGAADDLLITRSALSKQISLLERELGAELFVRGGGRRGVVLTKAGDALLPSAEVIVAAMNEGRRQVQAVSGSTTGRVNVVIGSGFESWPGWASIVSEFRSTHPELQLRFREGNSVAAMLESISNGLSDLAVMTMLAPPVAAGITIETLYTERMSVAVAPDHPYASLGKVRLEDLSEEEWLLSPSQRLMMVESGAEIGTIPQVAFEDPTPTVVRSLVLAGEGIAILGESEFDFWQPATILAFTDPMMTYTIALAYRDRQANGATKAARNFLRAQFGL